MNLDEHSLGLKQFQSRYFDQNSLSRTFYEGLHKTSRRIFVSWITNTLFMILRLYKPHPELQHFISRIMINRFQLDKTLPRPTNPFPPQPGHCLYFYPHDKIICRNYADGSVKESPRSILIGPQLSRVDLTMGYTMLVVMIGFQPGGMHRLLGIPMDEILDTPIDSSLLLGSEIDDITERLNETVDLDKMVEIVQQYLLKKVRRLKRLLPIDEVLIRMQQHKNLLSVDQLADQACISIRQLERQFKERAGMPPKMFLKLLRFSQAWIMREKNPSASWLQIAHTCHYADQMHMIRDFKAFAGVTPGILQNDLEKSPLRLQASSFD